jgi:GntR family transcriptional regulator
LAHGLTMNETLMIGRLEPALLDESLPTPLYHQIYLVLREKIRRGDLSAESTLPGEQELARQFKVSRITVKRALNELASDGLVTRHRGRGTIIVGGPSVPVVKGSFDNLIESLKLMGLETEVELLDVAEMAAQGDVALHLALKPGSPVQRAMRLRKLQGEPFSYLVTYVPAAIARRYSIEELASTPILTLLERAGASVMEAEQWISAAAAEPQIAAALGIAVGDPLLKIERVMRNAKSEPVQLIYAHYRPDRFQYHVKSHRRRHGTGASATWREDA